VDPSACCLLYLFADEVVNEVTFWGRLRGKGVAPPCGLVPVQLAPLEKMLLAWAFWSLHDQGLIDICKSADDSFYLEVRRRSSRRHTQGLEGQILTSCHSRPERILVVVRRWAPAKPVPFGTVVDIVKEEATSCGVSLDRSEPRSRKRNFRRYRAEPTFDNQHSALEARFLELLDSWRCSAADEDGLADAILRQCSGALVNVQPMQATGIAFDGPAGLT
jgi:hypothetical protein